MFRRILASLVIIPIIILLIYSYLQLRSNSSKHVNLTAVLPDNIVVLIECDDVAMLINTINSASDTSLKKHFVRQELFGNINSFLLGLNKYLQTENELSKILATSTIYASCNDVGKLQTDWFYCVNIPNEIDKVLLENAIKKIVAAPCQFKKNGECTDVIITPTNKFTFYFEQGIFALSSNAFLTKTSWLKLSKPSPNGTNKNIENLMKLSATNSLISIYVDAYKTENIVSNYFGNSINRIAEKPNCNYYSGDVELNENFVFTNGYAIAESKNYVAPQNFEMASVIPSKLANFNWYGVNSSIDYFGAKKIKANSLLSLFDNEFATLQTKLLNSDINSYSYQILKLKNSENFREAILKVDSTSSCKFDADSIFTIPIKIAKSIIDTTIITNRKAYCKQFYNYIYIANSKLALLKIDEQLKQSNTLLNSASFKNCKRKVETKANFISIKNPELYSDYLLNETTRNGKFFILKNKEWFKNLDLIYYSKSNFKSNNIINFYAAYSHIRKAQNNYAWQVNSVSSENNVAVAQIIEDTLSSVFIGNGNNTQIISDRGKSLSISAVLEPIIGEWKIIKSKKSSNIYCVANSKNSIYMFNALGEIQKGFPIKISKEIVGEISVCYNSKDEGRIALVNSNRKVILYDITGQLLSEFANPALSNDVKNSIKTVVINGKTFYYSFDVDGKYLCIDGKGKMNLKNDSIPIIISNIKKFETLANEKIVVLADNIISILNPSNFLKSTTVNCGVNVLDFIATKNSIVLFTTKGIIEYDLDSKKIKEILFQNFNNIMVGKVVFKDNLYMFILDQNKHLLYQFNKENKLIEIVETDVYGMPQLVEKNDELHNLLLVFNAKNKIKALYLNEK